MAVAAMAVGVMAPRNPPDYCNTLYLSTARKQTCTETNMHETPDRQRGQAKRDQRLDQKSCVLACFSLSSPSEAVHASARRPCCTRRQLGPCCIHIQLLGGIAFRAPLVQ